MTTEEELAQPATKGDLRQLAAKIPELNGAVPALKRIAGMEPDLQTVTQIAPHLVALAALQPQLTILVTEVLPEWRKGAETAADHAAFWRVVRRTVGWRYTRFVAAASAVTLFGEEPAKIFVAAIRRWLHF